MISIVTAYYNRKKQFYQTLVSIQKTKSKDFEVIVVDDGSSIEHRIDDYIDEFSFLKVIRIEPKDKWYVNPCVPYNIGIKASNGNIIILQNPECLHVHDILTYVNENIDDTKYISISAYALDEISTNEVSQLTNNEDLLTYFKSLPQKTTGGGTILGWYNHSIYRPVHFHFCSAITKINMEKLNGFDERYAFGIAGDDVEFIDRIGRLKLNKIIADDVSVIHQWHEKSYYSLPNASELRKKSSILYSITSKENIIRADSGYNKC